MKKIMYFALIIVLVVGVTVFGAWSPVSQVEATETRYADAPMVSSIASTSIYFTSRDIVEEHNTDGGAPIYDSNEGLANACGPIAGTAITAFYDKYYPNLIPNWDSYYPATGKYRLQVAQTVPVLNEMYTLMQTNVNGDGVSESEFKTGLQKYFTNHGYTASFQNVKSGSTLNYSACKTAIDSNKVIVLFTSPGNVYDVAEYADHDNILSFSITGNHIMYAYGYFQLKYYNSAGLFRTDTYLLVSTGRSSLSIAYYRVDSSNLDAAYIVNVS